MHQKQPPAKVARASGPVAAAAARAGRDGATSDSAPSASPVEKTASRKLHSGTFLCLNT